ncbi:MAG: hypothetical protein E7410_04040 [Ruminococcaceae bacterium]|nr:hypothetical protein [Oscillospiraceae bacterium]
MINLSIMALDEEHIDEICEDIIEQQRTGVSTHALFFITINPEYTPAIDKATPACKLYDKFAARLDKAGAKHGILAQATMGHIVVPREMYPFQPSVSLITGEDRVVTCCPLDPNFHEYIKEQMKILAKHKPSMIMIDDDIGLLYKQTKGCACKHHLAEFNKRAGTNMTREELYAHTQGTSEEDKYYTQIYVDVQRHGLVSAVKAMREGIDEVDPTIQGAVSGIYVGGFCEFSGDTAKAFAGKGNPAIIRLNGGAYSKSSTGREFSEWIYRGAILKENVKNDVDIYLAETDTCPFNRYSTSAARMHAHFAALILEGASGAKHWITRLGAHEPNSGKAYRKILAKYNGYYEKLVEYAKELESFGARMPLTLKQNYGFVPEERGLNLCPWTTCVLERFGIPVYFSNDEGGAVFLDDFTPDAFSDEDIKKFLSGTAVLSAVAAEKLCQRGFGEHIGVDAREWNGKKMSYEVVYGKRMAVEYEPKELVVLADGVEELSQVIHINSDGKPENLYPGVTRFENSLGGEVIVFAGSPDMPFKYFTAFSLLNETRKKQFTDILSRRNHIPLYYPEDAEIYLRAGYLKDGSIMAAFFNLGFDQLEDIAFVCDKKVNKVEKLNPDGTRSEVEFEIVDGVVRVKEMLYTLMPEVLFIS